MQNGCGASGERIFMEQPLGINHPLGITAPHHRDAQMPMHTLSRSKEIKTRAKNPGKNPPKNQGGCESASGAAFGRSPRSSPRQQRLCWALLIFLSHQTVKQTSGTGFLSRSHQGVCSIQESAPARTNSPPQTTPMISVD